MSGSIDKGRVEKAVREILEAIGEDPDRDGLLRTPERVAAMYEEIFGGLHEDPAKQISVTFEAEHDEMVMVRDIPLHSVCVPSKERINTPTGVKQARNVRVGDVLWTYDEEGALVTTHVDSVAWRKTKELVELTVAGHPLRLTLDHPVLTPQGWVAAGTLVAGDKVQWMNPRHMCQEQYPITEGYQLGYALGAIGCDASVQDGRRISLVVRDREFAQRFANALKVAFDIAAHVEPIEVPSGFLERLIPMYRVRIVSSYIGRLVLHWFGGSKATRAFHFPRVVLRSQEMMQGFIDGYVDGDGCRVKGTPGASIIISANDAFLEELAAVLWFEARGGKRPRRAFEPVDVPLLPPDADWVPIENVTTIVTPGSKPYTVYSFDCSPHSTFLVSGVLTHNCEHHLTPFAGKAHVAYIPGSDGRIIGLSKIARLVDGFARRPQVQERLTTQIADALVQGLEPEGVLVMIEAEHLCMSMRGVKKPGALTVTSAVRGLFKTNAATRAEAMSLITHPGNRL